MLERLRGLFFEADEAADHDADAQHDRLHIAAAALLMEAARLDGQVEELERREIRELLQNRFGLSDEEARELAQEAERQAQEAVELSDFVGTVNDEFSEREKVELMEMLWRVAYSDGVLHELESQLCRRAAGLLHVSDYHSGRARQRARSDLGLDSGDDAP